MIALVFNYSTTRHTSKKPFLRAGAIFGGLLFTAMNAWALNAPSNLNATTGSANRIDLTWQDNSTFETGFHIQRSSDGINFTFLANVGQNTISYSDAALPPSTTYWYRVKACNSTGCSAWSNVDLAGTDVAPIGVFSLRASGDTVLATDADLNNPNVAGISARLAWSDAETSDGNFTALFNYFDSVVQACQQKNKPVILRVDTGGDDASISCTGGNKPDWLIKKIRSSPADSTDEFVTVNDTCDGSCLTCPKGTATTKDIPVYWSTTLISAEKAMYQAIGQRYNGNGPAALKLTDGTPVIKHIVFGVVAQNTTDWAVDDSPATTTEWQNLLNPWTNDKIVKAHTDIANTIVQYCTGQSYGCAFNPSGWNIDNPTRDTDHHRLEKAVINALIAQDGVRFCPQKNNLNALQGPPTQATQPPNGGNYDILAGTDQSNVIGTQTFFGFLPPKQPRACQDVWNVFNDGTYRYNGGTVDNKHTIFGRGSDTLAAIKASFSETYKVDCNADWASLPNADGSTPGRDEIAYRKSVLLGP